MMDRVVAYADVQALKGASDRLRNRGIDSLPGFRMQDRPQRNHELVALFLSVGLAALSSDVDRYECTCKRGALAHRAGRNREAARACVGSARPSA